MSTKRNSLPPLYRLKLGKTGEDLAVSYLQKNNYVVISRNFKARYGELDVVALKNKTLIFVEVKTRVGNEFGLPEEAVTPRKLREVIKTAQYFLLKNPHFSENYQIDVIAIQLDDEGNQTYFNHLQNVTL